ncbi:superoxide dismutase [Neptunicella marina]|uniref:Superoxide dismutase n=1 Tax=Neptunicella marina TaxID=2125989 RepID=A0A8J6LYP8_9ALTE|nr:Fe-Mn family superoxide dismutase [Neptunicella marina]MBC3765530.1 superoxide dismutase [Fe] [Neptunicella marina]
MPFELPKLPYATSSLHPFMSEETFNFHYLKHHATYVDKLNALIKQTAMESLFLEQIIRQSSGAIFNNAAQVWNHTFFWHCLSPDGGNLPQGILLDAIVQNWGAFEEFKRQFTEQAINNFGSGWTWLVATKDGKLEIINTSNAATPVTQHGVKPLLTVDVWEHAYYIDHRNARPAYLDAFWNIVNWSFAEANFEHEELESLFAHLSNS